MVEISLSNTSRFIKFSLLVLFATVSTVCSLYIIYNVIKCPSFRQRFQNQTLIILVFLVLFDIIFNIPTTFSFYARGYVLYESDLFCHMWQIMDYIFTSSIVWCKAIFTLERYILIFYPHYLRTQQQKLIFHYIPLILIFLYLNLFYIFYDMFASCLQKPRYDQHLCGHQCLDHESAIPIFNWSFNILFPVFLIIFGSLFLLLHVLWTRRQMQRNLRNWSKNWKMIIQLFGISIIYAIVWLPLSVISTLTIIHSDNESIANIADNFYFITYLCELVDPIIALLFWPEITQKLRRRFRPNTVGPLTIGPYSTN